MLKPVATCAGILVRTTVLALGISGTAHAGALVLQSDFGTQDAAVAAMKGVVVTIEPELQIYDLTHEIPAYDVWQAAHRSSSLA